MTAPKEIDVASENEKAKANMALLENLLELEKQKRVQEQAKFKNNAEVKDPEESAQLAKRTLLCSSRSYQFDNPLRPQKPRIQLSRLCKSLCLRLLKPRIFWRANLGSRRNKLP